MLKRIVSAVLALMLLATVVIPVGAFETHSPARGWIKHQGTTVEYSIPVCLGTNMGGTTWDLSVPKQARLNEAMEMWNDANADMRYYRGTASCGYYENNGIPYVKVNIATDTPKEELGYTDGRGTLCNEPWGIYCVDRAIIWIDNSYDLSFSSNVGDMNNEYDFRTAVAHELGHALGLSEEPDLGTANLMYPTIAKDLRKFMSYDTTQGILWYYGPCGSGGSSCF